MRSATNKDTKNLKIVGSHPGLLLAPRPAIAKGPVSVPDVFSCHLLNTWWGWGEFLPQGQTCLTWGEGGGLPGGMISAQDCMWQHAPVEAGVQEAGIGSQAPMDTTGLIFTQIPFTAWCQKKGEGEA